MIELLVVVAIIAILAALLLPALARAKESGRRVKCLNNMRQMGLALALYEQDFRNLPESKSDIPDFLTNPEPTFLKAILPFCSTNLFVCPSVPTPSPLSSDAPGSRGDTTYLGNALVMGRSSAIVPKPVAIIILQECIVRINKCSLRPRLEAAAAGGSAAQYGWWHDSSGFGYELYSSCHSVGANQLFADGHILYRKRTSLFSREFGLDPGDDTQAADSGKKYRGAF